ncbi:hypothetical protein AMECASPLE_006124 [Ameca splendens]|uniref:Uncharacterized protein n=1 Tax=Ameca splendens TaxID=208324 RepID=A0ABV0Z827_9TELE
MASTPPQRSSRPSVSPSARPLPQHGDRSGVSIPERCGRDLAGTFVSQSAAQLDRPGILVAPPPGLPGAVGIKDDATGPAVGHFSHQQLSFWAAHTLDPWVVATLTHGYRLQLRLRPPFSRGVKMTVIADP